MHGKYQFNSPDWDDVSNNAKDLVCTVDIIIISSFFATVGALVHIIIILFI